MSPRTRTVLAWAMVAPWIAWAVIRLLGLDSGFPLVPLLAFTPYAAATAPVAAAAAAFLGRRAPAVCAAAAALTLLAVLAPRAFSGGPEAPPGAPSLRVLSMNLYRGEAGAGRVLELVRDLRPDVVAFQELTPQMAARLRARGLGGLLGHRLLAVEAGVSGSGIYARRPLRSTGSIPGIFRMPRAVLAKPGLGEVEIVCIHPYPPTDPRSVDRWIASLSGLPAAGEGPPLRVLAGDFNATLDHSELRDLIGDGYRDAADARGKGFAPTWHDGRLYPPPLTIDHVLADERLAVADFSVHDLPGSDHEAIFAELVLLPAA